MRELARAGDILHAAAKRNASKLREAPVVRTTQFGTEGGEAAAHSLTEYLRSRFQLDGDPHYYAAGEQRLT